MKKKKSDKLRKGESRKLWKQRREWTEGDAILGRMVNLQFKLRVGR